MLAACFDYCEALLLHKQPAFNSKQKHTQGHVQHVYDIQLRMTQLYS